MARIHADPVQLWDLYSMISNAKQEISGECDKVSHSLEILKERLEEQKKQILVEINNLEAELAMIQSKKNQAQEEGKPTAELDAMGGAIRAKIDVLEEKLNRVRQLGEKTDRYKDDIEKEKQQCVSSLRKSGKRVNRYVKFLENLLLEADYQEYQESREDSIAGDYSGKYHTMSFRGNTFYCNDEEIDLDKTDSQGQTNLARMEKGLAPVGSDGLPVNLHHMQQSESGTIIELSEVKHTQNHKMLHINTNDIPSGINRSTFQILKSAYWKRRSAFIKKSQGR